MLLTDGFVHDSNGRHDYCTDKIPSSYQVCTILWCGSTIMLGEKDGAVLAAQVAYYEALWSRSSSEINMFQCNLYHSLTNSSSLGSVEHYWVQLQAYPSLSCDSGEAATQINMYAE